MASVAASVAKLTHPSSQTGLGSDPDKDAEGAEAQSAEAQPRRDSLLCVSFTPRPWSCYASAPLRLCTSASSAPSASSTRTIERSCPHSPICSPAKRARASSTRRCPTGGCAATRAATAVRCPKARVGVCKVRFNQGGRLHGAVGLRRRRPVRSDREEAVLPRAIPARWPTASGCSAAICTAAYCQNWVTSQALRDPAAVAPPLGGLARSARARRAPPGRAGDRQHLQRAAHHERMGGRRLQGSEEPPGSSTGVRVERQRDAASARVPAAVGRPLQGRSQELRRSPLPAARRAPRADPRHDPAPARDGLLGGDRHAAHSRLQRLARRAGAAHGVRRRASRRTSRGTSRRSTATTR